MNPFLPIFIAIFVAGLFAPPGSERAYLDPGSGSFIVQLLIASAVGAAFATRMYWQKMKAGIQRMLGKTPEEPLAPPHSDDSENNA